MLDTADISGDSVSGVAVDVIEMITRTHVLYMSLLKALAGIAGKPRNVENDAHSDKTLSTHSLN